MPDAHTIARQAAAMEAVKRARRAARMRDHHGSPTFTDVTPEPLMRHLIGRHPYVITDVAPDPAPLPARPSLLQRIRARVAAAIAWLFSPPLCEHCGAELRVYDVWYPPTPRLEPTPVYLWHCPSCEPIEARDPA